MLSKRNAAELWQHGSTMLCHNSVSHASAQQHANHWHASGTVLSAVVLVRHWHGILHAILTGDLKSISRKIDISFFMYNVSKGVHIIARVKFM